MAGASFYKTLAKWVVKRGGPYFVMYVWPIVQKHVLDISERLALNAKDSIYEWMGWRTKTQADAAERKATEAEQTARTASTEAEAEKYRAVAQVWREVAEQFRKENEELKAKVEDVLKKSESDFTKDIGAMDVKEIIEEAGATPKALDSDTVRRLAAADSGQQMTLYERLGGVYAIATVVDDFIDRVMNDPRLNANPKVNEAHHKVAPAGFKYLVTEQVCEATGGPQRYTGRSMSDSHSHLEINEQEWQAFLDDFRQTLDKFKVPLAEQAQLFAMVESTKYDIVMLGKNAGK